jgi:hypothetical protein
LNHSQLLSYTTGPRNAFSRVQVSQLSYKYNADSDKERETGVLFRPGTNDDSLTGSSWLIDRNTNGTILLENFQANIAETRGGFQNKRSINQVIKSLLFVPHFFMKFLAADYE